MDLENELEALVIKHGIQKVLVDFTRVVWKHAKGRPDWTLWSDLAYASHNYYSDLLRGEHVPE